MVRTSDSQSRESGFESSCCCFEKLYKNVPLPYVHHTTAGMLYILWLWIGPRVHYIYYYSVSYDLHSKQPYSRANAGGCASFTDRDHQHCQSMASYFFTACVIFYFPQHRHQVDRTNSSSKEHRPCGVNESVGTAAGALELLSHVPLKYIRDLKTKLPQIIRKFVKLRQNYYIPYWLQYFTRNKEVCLVVACTLGLWLNAPAGHSIHWACG